MYKKELTEFIIHEQLLVIQMYPALNGAIQLHLDTYTQILDVFSSTNEYVRELIDELSRTKNTFISEATSDKDVNQAPTRSKTEKVEMIITELVMKIQNNPSLKKSISFHARVYGQILNAVHSTNKELIDKLGQLKYESFKANLNDL
ncbi:hypothetical protein [Enterococcus sp. AZ192]|uniref:hypothetical protein n=1 Tax=unclassified Enterococcus TaxID=2608891 RepID=UPI003D2E3A66